MRAFLSIATAALLAIHTVFGCCWHHAHAYEHDFSFSAVSLAECCDHDSRQGQHDDEKPCQDTDHCAGTCTYVAPQKVRLDGPTSSASLDLVAVPVAAQDLPALVALARVCGSPSEFAPPLRRHLLHQILLI